MLLKIGKVDLSSISDGDKKFGTVYLDLMKSNHVYLWKNRIKLKNLNIIVMIISQPLSAKNNKIAGGITQEM